MPDLRTLADALSDAASSDEGYLFLVGGDEVRRPYAEIRQTALGVAQSLSESGLEPGDLVAIVINDAEQFLTAFLGVSVAGMVPASLYPPSTTSELPAYLELTAGIVRSSAARGVITTSALKPWFDDLAPSCPALTAVLAREALGVAPASGSDHQRGAARVGIDDIAFVQFTSGSTSSPKGVALTHKSLSANIAAISGPCGLKASDGDLAVSWLPLFHDMGLVGIALGALYSVRPAVIMTPHAFVKRPAEWLRAITRYRGTISFAPNFAYDLCVRRVKDRDLEGLDLSAWRIAGCGAEPIHAPTLTAFAEKFAPVGFRASSFLASYGLAEHVVAATFAPLNRLPRVEQVDAADLTDRRIARPSPRGQTVAVVGCGMPFPDHQIRIIGEDGREAPERGVGEITLRGPSVMLGYYKDDELSAQTIRDGWLHTGDLGYLAGGELFVCGRVKDIIIANGRKYHPQDLEWAVDQLPGVRRGRVVAFGSAQAGGPDRVVVVVEPNRTIATEPLTEAIRRCIGDLCGLYVDDVVLVANGTIGRTTSGKVQRAATKARFERGELAAAHDRAGLHA
ncbi:MAG TPA: fatty acyl-AMP ligase [Vicinamibacterales bacterium]|jgi:fatty-acyl-CoA synthase